MTKIIQPYVAALQNPSELQNPIFEVEGLLREVLNIIGKKMILSVKALHPGDEANGIPFHEVSRVRSNNKETDIYNTRASLSFKPQDFNKNYQRASTPDQTMFYGALLDFGEKAILPNRLTSSLEGIPWLRDPESTGKQKVTYSKWIVTKHLALHPVIFNQAFAHNTHVAQHLEETINSIKTLNPEFADDIQGFYEFISSEFAKPHVDSADINYLTTALYTKIILEVTKGNYDGILYPSCRVYGDGTNIAILPEATEKLALVVAGECMIYKHKKNIIIDNLTVSDSDGKTPLTTFDLIPIEKSQTRGEKKCYNDLGVTSLEYRSN